MVYAAILCISPILPTRNEYYQTYYNWPLGTISNYSKIICVGLCILLLLSVISHLFSQRKKLFSLFLLAFLFFELAFGARMGLGGLVMRGTLAMVVFAFCFVTLGCGVQTMMDDVSDIAKLVRVMVFSVAVFVVLHFYQIVVGHHQLYENLRFSGLTYNPQSLGIYIGFMLPFVFAHIKSPSIGKWEKKLSYLLLGVLVIFVAITGSRTGVLISFIAISLSLRTHIKSVLTVGVFIFLVVSLYLEKRRHKRLQLIIYTLGKITVNIYQVHQPPTLILIDSRF